MYRDPTVQSILYTSCTEILHILCRVLSIFCLMHCFIAKSKPSLEFLVSFYDSCNHKNVYYFVFTILSCTTPVTCNLTHFLVIKYITEAMKHVFSFSSISKGFMQDISSPSVQSLYTI